MLTQESLKKKLAYNPKTGVFTWISGNRRGQVAGSINPIREDRSVIAIMIGGKSYGAHRLAFLWMEGSIPEQVDHIDQDPLNNSWENLRQANPLINSRNKRRYRNNTTGIPGVCFTDGTYLAYIYVFGKQRKLGRHKDFFEACCRRKSAELRYGFHPNHGR